MSGQFDWTQIEGIRYSFKKHNIRQYKDCHSILNQLSSEIDLPPSLFDEDGTLSTDFTTAIKTAVVNDILQILVDAPSDYINNDQHISSLFDNSLMYRAGNQATSPLRMLRSSRAFINAAQGALADDETYIDIFFSIDHWHFNLARWTALNFDYVSRELPEETPTVETPQDNPTTNVNQGQNEAITAIAARMEQLAHIFEQAGDTGQNPNPAPAQQAIPGVQNPHCNPWWS